MANYCPMVSCEWSVVDQWGCNPCNSSLVMLSFVTLLRKELRVEVSHVEACHTLESLTCSLTLPLTRSLG